MAWTKAALGEEEVASIESSIADDIAKSKVPVTTSTNPWDMGDDF